MALVYGVVCIYQFISAWYIFDISNQSHPNSFHLLSSKWEFYFGKWCNKTAQPSIKCSFVNFGKLMIKTSVHLEPLVNNYLLDILKKWFRLSIPWKLMYDDGWNLHKITFQFLCISYYVPTTISGPPGTTFKLERNSGIFWTWWRFQISSAHESTTMILKKLKLVWELKNSRAGLARLGHLRYIKYTLLARTTR